MVMSKRERYIGIITGTVLAILVVDRFFVTPLMERQAELDGRIKLARQELDRTTGLRETGRRARDVWTTMDRGSLLRDDSDAESQILNGVREWAQEAGINLSSQKRERTEKEGDFVKITYRVTGGGTLPQAARFLYRMQNATVPVRITDFSANSKKDGTDDLNLSVGVSTIYFAPDADKDKNNNGGNANARTASAPRSSYAEVYR